MSDSFSNADQIAIYDKIAASYADANDGRADFEEINAFLKHVPPGGKIVDAGCAAGRDTAIFTSLGYKAVGFDLSKGLLAEAKKRHPEIEFMYGDLLKIPLDSDSFDGVWSRASLVHMENKEDAIQAIMEFFRILKSGGVVFVQTRSRNKSDPETGSINDTLSGAKRYFRFYTLEEITGYAKKAGFEIVSLQQYNEKDRPAHITDKSKVRDVDWLIFIARKP